MSGDFVQDLFLHLKAEYPLVFVLSQEENRALSLIEEAAAKADLKLFAPREIGQTLAVADLISAASGEGVIVLDDAHRRMDDPATLRALADLAAHRRQTRSTAVILAPWVDLPPELERLSAVIELPLPTPAELRKVLEEVCAEVNVLQTDQDAADLTRSAQGLTEEESRRAFRKAMIGWPEDADSAIDSVATEKKRALHRSRVLEHVSAPASLDDVGGLDQLKSWLSSRTEAFTDRARQYGLPAPRGLLLMGVQGCGKSLTAKAVAGHWRLPLVRLDLPAVFGALRPEEALRGALRVAEAMAPVVLWIDEIEKGFESGREGKASRLLGGMVTWLQEKIDEVFVVATANRVAILPPELPRKGRFDEIFFVDLPDFHERLEILKLHVSKRGRNPVSYSLEALAKKAEKMTGSELEQIVVSAMYAAFTRSDELGDDDLIRALKETVSLYDTFEEEIKALREWARKRARPASTDRRKIDLFANKT